MKCCITPILAPLFWKQVHEFLGTYDKLVPRDQFAAAGIQNLNTFPGPTPGFIEQVFLLQGCPDEHGFAHQLLVNAAKDLAAKVSYQVATLPIRSSGNAATECAMAM